MTSYLKAFICATALVTSMSWAESVLTIGTFNHYPYHYNKDGLIRGDAVNTVECVLNSMNRTLKLEIYPQKRGIQLFKSGKLDGLLSYQPFQEKGFRSVASHPIVFERWNLYYASEGVANSLDSWKTLLNGSRVGSVRGSSIDAWLRSHEISAEYRVESFDQLIKMLYQNRIDVFIADERSTGETINEGFNGHNFSFKQKFVAFSPLSIHFSQGRLGEEEFLTRFNSYISSCRPKSLELKYNEGKFVLEKAKLIFDEYINTSIIRNKVLASNLAHSQKLEESQVARMEKKWDIEKNSHEGDLVSSVVQSEVADILRDIMKSTEGNILEIIVMNKHGVNIASTGITSDYYQGDEEKYRKTYLKNSSAIHLSDVRFDGSSNNFGAQVSFTLSNNGVSIGAVTLTMNVYRVFQ